MATKQTTKPATPVTPTPVPATPDEPKPVATVADFSPADTNIDRSGYVAAFASLTTALGTFVQGVAMAGEGSRLGAFAILDLKRSCLRTDNGAPDWSGGTSGYREGLGTFLDRWASSNTFTGPDGTPQTITGDHVRMFRSRCSSYASDHQLLHRAMAEHEAATNTKSPATVAQVRAAWDAPAGTSLPDNVRQTEKVAMARQVSAKGKVLPNFDPDLNLANVSGRKPKPSGGGGGGDNASETTAAKGWAVARKQIAKGDGGFLPVDKLAQEVLHVASLALLQLTGPVGEKVPANASLPAQGKGRKDALTTYGQLRDLIEAAIAALDPNQKDRTKDAMTDLLWSETS